VDGAPVPLPAVDVAPETSPAATVAAVAAEREPIPTASTSQ
jgi:hypothetical protein